jgi:hypothetical protein
VIIKARFRKAHGIVSHLLDINKNSAIKIRADLGRFAPNDLDHAVRAMATVAESNPRTKRHLLEVIIAPSVPIHEDQLERMLKCIDIEFQIPFENGRVIVEHQKGERANHFHVLYGLVNPASGMAMNSWGTFTKSEFIARQFELQNGLPITGQKISDTVVHRLKELGFQPTTEKQAPRRGERVGRGNRRQLERMQQDVRPLCRIVGECWRASANDDDFRERLKRKLLFLAKGEKAILVVTRKGAQVSLIRALRQDARDRGVKSEDDFSTPDINTRFAKERDLADMLFMLKNSDDQFREDMRKLRLMLTAGMRTATADYCRTLRVANDAEFRQRQNSLSIDQRRDDLRRLRVHRAFAAAEVFDHPQLRRLAMVAAALGVILVGGGLGLALLAGGAAASALPTRELARAIALAARLERKAEFDQRQRQLQDAYRKSRLMTEYTIDAREMDRHFNQGDAEQKALVGLYAHLTLRRMKRPLTEVETGIYGRTGDALGQDCCGWINNILERGGFGDVMRIIRAYDPADQKQANSIGVVAIFADIGPEREGVPQYKSDYLDLVALGRNRPDYLNIFGISENKTRDSKEYRDAGQTIASGAIKKKTNSENGSPAEAEIPGSVGGQNVDTFDLANKAENIAETSQACAAASQHLADVDLVGQSDRMVPDQNISGVSVAQAADISRPLQFEDQPVMTKGTTAGVEASVQREPRATTADGFITPVVATLACAGGVKTQVVASGTLKPSTALDVIVTETKRTIRRQPIKSIPYKKKDRGWER